MFLITKPEDGQWQVWVGYYVFTFLEVIACAIHGVAYLGEDYNKNSTNEKS